jgi:hypothetical protein
VVRWFATQHGLDSKNVPVYTWTVPYYCTGGHRRIPGTITVRLAGGGSPPVPPRGRAELPDEVVGFVAGDLVSLFAGRSSRGLARSVNVSRAGCVIIGGRGDASGRAGGSCPMRVAPGGTPMKRAVPVVAAVLAGVLGASPAAAHTRRTVTVDEHQAGKVVRVHKGDQVTLALHNTYWTIGAAHGKVLQTAGGQQHTHARMQGCIPGGGCGTVTRSFVAAHEGRAGITASRTTCGEAMRCTGTNGSDRVTIRVVP